MISFKEYHTLKEADMETAKDIIQDIQDLVRKNDGKFTDETEKHVNKAIQKNKDDISTLENILNAVTGYLQNPTSAMERVLTGRMFQITKQLKPKNKKPEEKGKAAQAEPPPKEEGSAEEVDDGDEELSPNNPNVREKIEETPTPDNDTEKALISALQSKDFKTAFVTLRQFVRDSIDKTAFSDFSKVKHVLSNMNDQETPFDLKKLLPLMKDPISAIPIIANLVYAGTMTQKAFELMGQADKDAFVDNKVKRFRKMLNGTGASNLESLVGLYRDSMGDMRMKIKALKRIPDPPKFDQEFSLKTAQNFVTAGIGKIKKEEHIGKLNNALKIFQKWKEGDTKKLDEVIQKEKDPSQVIEVIARNKGLDVNELKQFIDTNYKEQETPPSKNPNDNQENITKKTENPPAGSSDNSSGEIKGSPPSKNSQDDFSDPSQEKPPSEQNNIKDNKENQTPKLQSEEDYINEINKICDAALEHIKKNYGKKEDVQESINKAIKTVIQEGIGIFRTHRSDGTETKSYANAKQKVEDEASALIEKFRNAAIQQVTKYWDAAYGDKIISTNGRFNAKVKVKNAIPQLNAKLAKLRYKSGKKTSQNLVGMVAGGVTEAGKTIVGDVGKSISNSSLGRRVKDLAKTGAQLAKDKAQEIKRLDNDNTSANTLAALVEIEKDTTKLIEIQKQLKPYFERAKIANPKLTPEQFVKGKALPLRLNWEKEKIKTNSTADWYNIFQTQPAEAQKVLSKSLSSITANEMPKEKEEEDPKQGQFDFDFDNKKQPQTQTQDVNDAIRNKTKEPGEKAAEEKVKKSTEDFVPEDAIKPEEKLTTLFGKNAKQTAEQNADRAFDYLKQQGVNFFTMAQKDKDGNITDAATKQMDLAREALGEFVKQLAKEHNVKYAGRTDYNLINAFWKIIHQQKVNRMQTNTTAPVQNNQTPDPNQATASVETGAVGDYVIPRKIINKEIQKRLKNALII